jgi:hypothetical protein
MERSAASRAPRKRQPNANATSDPCFEEDEEERTYTLAQWLNINSFAARLYGCGLGPSRNFGLWQLRDALEEERPPGHDANTAISVASEWIVHAGQAITWRCLQSEPMEEWTLRSERAGSLYAGLPGFNLDSWRYWKRRLAELRGSVSDRTKRRIDEGVKAMIDLEVAMAEKLGDFASGTAGTSGGAS